MYLEPHDYRIYYVNIDLRHQYGISVAESQTFLPAKRPQRRRARRNGCFRKLVPAEKKDALRSAQKSSIPVPVPGTTTRSGRKVNPAKLLGFD